ncbi:MAG: T9SS type A sorting domain-containing protein [Bacteroidota bacterium]
MATKPHATSRDRRGVIQPIFLGTALLCLLTTLSLTTRWDVSSESDKSGAASSQSHARKTSRSQSPNRMQGPLHVSPLNRRYFTDSSGRAILLAGSHTWATMFDQGGSDPPPAFNITQFLDFLQAYGHNFTRTFVWEQSRWGTWTNDDNYWFFPGPPYKRTGPGLAEDGKPKFNLDSLSQSYFDWMHRRVDSLNSRGIYCSIQFFDGWSLYARNGIGNPWRGHPFKASNNENGMNGDPNNDNGGQEIHSLMIPSVWPYQERYIKRLIDDLNDFNNIIWEVSNESSYPGSEVWERRIIDTIRAYELRKPKQHPIGYTADWSAPLLNEEVFSSRADWISPGAGNNGDIWKNDPPDSGGAKVVINDTDHLWGNGGDAVWVWKSFLRGNNVLYMDGYNGAAYGTGHPWTQGDSANPSVVELRRNLGYILRYGNRMNLIAMTPHSNLSSTTYCLANPTLSGAEYLAFRPTSSGSILLDLSGTPGTLKVEWFNPSTGDTSDSGTISGGASRSFNPPFTGEAVLYVYQSSLSGLGLDGSIPREARLMQNYPNPFNPSTVIEFGLPKRSHVNLELYSLLGERLAAIVDETLSPGYYSVPFNATRLASGVYLYRMQAGDFVETKKMVILK